jgi:hypothetical protein
MFRVYAPFREGDEQLRSSVRNVVHLALLNQPSLGRRADVSGGEGVCQSAVSSLTLVESNFQG